MRAAMRVAGRLFGRGERGATAVEYAIMVSAIAVAVILAVVFLGQRTNDNFTCTGDSIVAKTSVC